MGLGLLTQAQLYIALKVSNSPVICHTNLVFKLTLGVSRSLAGALEAWLLALFDTRVAAGVRLQYGGSVTAENIDGLIALPDVDDALVGGASLKVDAFNRILQFSRS